MIQAQENDLLDFLAEGFLQQGASVTYIKLEGASALKVTSDDGASRIYIPAEEGVSKMAFLGGNISEEIIIPVLKSDEEFRLRNLLKKLKIKTVGVERLSIYQRYAWYSRNLKSNA